MEPEGAWVAALPEAVAVAMAVAVYPFIHQPNGLAKDQEAHPASHRCTASANQPTLIGRIGADDSPFVHCLA